LGLHDYQLAGGIAGALASLALAYALPKGIALAQGKGELAFEVKRVVGALIILVVMLGLGVVSAVLASSTDLKTAVVAGLGGQGTLSTIAKTLKH